MTFRQYAVIPADPRRASSPVQRRRARRHPRTDRRSSPRSGQMPRVRAASGRSSASARGAPRPCRGSTPRLGERTAKGGEVAKGKKFLDGLARGVVFRQDDTHCDRHENSPNKSNMQFSPQQMRFLWRMPKSPIQYPQFHSQNAGCVRR